VTEFCPFLRAQHFLSDSERNEQGGHGGADKAHAGRRRDGSGQMDGVDGEDSAVIRARILNAFIATPSLRLGTKV
jgi:hypothetical protein